VAGRETFAARASHFSRSVLGKNDMGAARRRPVLPAGRLPLSIRDLIPPLPTGPGRRQYPAISRLEGQVCPPFSPAANLPLKRWAQTRPRLFPTPLKLSWVVESTESATASRRQKLGPWSAGKSPMILGGQRLIFLCLGRGLCQKIRNNSLRRQLIHNRKRACGPCHSSPTCQERVPGITHNSGRYV